MLEKLTARLLMVSGLAIVLVGWVITEWSARREYDAFTSLLDPLGTLLRYGGFILLLAGIAWFAMVYYRSSSEKK